jgi:hypothetical protein
MNLDLNGTQPVRVYGLHSQLVVTTALILTFSPVEKGQRLHASLYAVVRRANPVACALWFRGSMRDSSGNSLPPPTLRFGAASPAGCVEAQRRRTRRGRNGFRCSREPRVRMAENCATIHRRNLPKPGYDLSCAGWDGQHDFGRLA